MNEMFFVLVDGKYRNLKEEPCFFKYASNAVKDNKMVVSYLITIYPYIIEDVSDRLKKIKILFY